MHLCYSTVLLTYCVAVLEARRADVDLNRVRLIAVEDSADSTAIANSHNQTSANPIKDVDDNRSGRFLQPQTYQRLRTPTTPFEPRPSLKVYQPKEDPRLFYQSDAYLKETLSGKVHEEVSKTYPKNDIVLANVKARGGTRTASMRLMDGRRRQRVFGSKRNVCIKCPAERTLIARQGSDRVILQKPKLTTCSGQRAPKNIRFVRMYGPTFGALLEKGFHTVVGKVIHKGQTLQHCRFEIQVVTQTCSAPEYLRMHCDTRNVCNFACRDRQLELYGKPNLKCGYNLRWEGTLPICKERSWCEYPSPPEYGRLSCVGATRSGRLAEGARCKARCRRGWRWSPRVAAVCSHGQWTTTLSCQPRHNQPQ